MKLYMIRHGRQCSNLCNVNVELSHEGHRQAQLTGERLKNYGIQGLYASELIRAQQTAAHISGCLALPVITAKQIEEIHFGDWTGKSDRELDEIWGDLRRQYREGETDVTYPSGESGQSCFKRYEEGMNWIINDAQEKGFSNIAIVTHGIAMRAFLCGVFGIPFARRGLLSYSLENGSITELSFEKGKYTLERFNDYAHLEPYDELLRKHFK